LFFKFIINDCFTKISLYECLLVTDLLEFFKMKYNNFPNCCLWDAASYEKILRILKTWHADIKFIKQCYKEIHLLEEILKLLSTIDFVYESDEKKDIKCTYFLV